MSLYRFLALCNPNSTLDELRRKQRAHEAQLVERLRRGPVPFGTCAVCGGTTYEYPHFSLDDAEWLSQHHPELPSPHSGYRAKDRVFDITERTAHGRRTWHVHNGCEVLAYHHLVTEACEGNEALGGWHGYKKGNIHRRHFTKPDGTNGTRIYGRASRWSSSSKPHLRGKYREHSERRHYLDYEVWRIDE